MVLADSVLHFAPLDIVAVAGPMACLMIALELLYYWRFGRRPAEMRGRMTIAIVLGCVLIPIAILLMHQWHASSLLLIAAMLLVWALHSYRRTTSPVSPRTKAICLGLRIAVICLLVLYLLRPNLRRVTVRYEKALLFILYDTSRSMTIDDAGDDGRTPRIEAVREAVATAAGRLERLSESFDVQQFRFDESLGGAVGGMKDLAGPAAGESTAIGRAVQQAYQSAMGRKVAGVILLTDGVNNLSGPETGPTQVADRLGRQSSPVAFWPVGVGRETPERDKPVVFARAIQLPAAKVPAFNVLTVTAVFQFINLADHPVKVELLFGKGAEMAVVDTKTIRPSAAKTSDTVTFQMEVTPKTTGLHSVTVRVAPGESAKGASLVSQASEVTDYVQVVDDLIQVLYVEGQFRLEAKYLIDALAASDLLRVNRQFILGPPTIGAASQLPKTAADWRRYHVVILGDAKANIFTAEQLRTIRTMVRDDGKGLMMLGGQETFGQGGWPDSPLADLFPFDLRQATGQIVDKFKLKATAPGLRHQIMRLADVPAANVKLWNMLPPLQGANRFPTGEQIQASRPGAVVLATTDTDRPVLVAQQAGAGRVLAVAMDTTWRWRMHMDEGRELHNRFWRQVVLWLANREGSVWVRTDQQRYRLRQVQAGAPGVDRQKVVVTAGMEDQTGVQVHDPGAKLVEIIPAADGAGDGVEVPVPLDYKGDHYEVELPPPQWVGNYQLRFSGTLDGKEVHAETSFIVESPQVELSRRLADFNLLRNMAEASADAGGQFYTLDQFADLLARFKSSDYLLKREDRVSTDLADAGRWWILLLIVAALTAEWMIRKRRALV